MARSSKGSFGLPKLPNILSQRETFSRGPVELQSSLQQLVTPKRPWQQVPQNWQGGAEDYAVYWAHEKLGKQPGIDFTYVPGSQGGVVRESWLAIEFVEHPGNLGLVVLEEQPQDAWQLFSARITRATMAGYQMTIIFLDGDKVLENPVPILEAAFRGEDHSRFASL
jgi:hypothetical protein